ncbi:lysylphosphatidylglycerol synthase transmembrane domain-containing protein [Roseovarius dicentrarchi]|uniref:lysylphosphatidylglycerol synthase transmembrane domain-containing protein n=1 Tax=Roseovarius dicentrarchi TaxID=2250573 RepID=UPI00193A6D7F|nr:lysylphosphatidylglycerol synthase transmembrane domain-containing protein [Roseovarius dicentrarchi]
MKNISVGSMARLGLGIAVAGFFVWLIARSVDMAELGAALAEANSGWIALAIVFFLLGYACRITRWRIMLRRSNPEIGWITCAIPFMGSIAANNVLPFRAGDALRALAFSGWMGVPTASVIATLLVERLLDLLSLLIALGLVLVIFDLGSSAPAALVGISGTGLIGVGLAVMALLLFPQIMEPLVRLLIRMVNRVVSANAGVRLSGISDKVFDTLRHLSQGPRMALLVLWSAAVWGLEGAVFWAAAHAVPSLETPVAGWLALPVGTLATLLPSTPGYIGTFDFFVIKAMEVMGNPAVAAAAFAVLVHFILWLPATLIGGACMAYWGLRRRSPPSSPRQESR